MRGVSWSMSNQRGTQSGGRCGMKTKKQAAREWLHITQLKRVVQKEMSRWDATSLHQAHKYKLQTNSGVQSFFRIERRRKL